MKNKKGFVMTETLVVTVFLVTIFTFVYVSIVPLYGKYEDKIYRSSDIDIIYKLYNIKKMIINDENSSTIATSTFKRITCNDLSDTAYCNQLMQYLDLSSYILVCADNINTRITNFANLNSEMYDYISEYRNFPIRVLVLFDQNKHTAAHLSYN